MACLGLAALCVAGDRLYLAILGHRLNAAIAACETENQQHGTSGPNGNTPVSQTPLQITQQKPSKTFVFTSPTGSKYEVSALGGTTAEQALATLKEQLYTALRNADAAGDKEAASKLVADIHSLDANGRAHPVDSMQSIPLLPPKYVLDTPATKTDKNPIDQLDKLESSKKKYDLSRFGSLVCVPADLSENATLPGVQGKIVTAYHDKREFEDNKAAHLFALALVILGILPAAWYFFLARLRELASAIRGK